MPKQIPGNADNDGTLLGVVKVQMPEQLDNDGSLRIGADVREQNKNIVRNTIAAFGNWAEQVGAPAIILFPEFSVSEEATDWLMTEIQTPHIAPNTLVVFGMEQISMDNFRARVTNSGSRADFDGVNFGPNVDRVNTAVILAKDNAGEATSYYQPKCSRSDYESRRQYVSNLVYEITFGQYNLVVSICSDFLLRDNVGTLVGSVMEELDRQHPQPRNHRLDLVLLVEKNASPLHPLYHLSIEHLFYNRPHSVQTTDTIVCAVNSVAAHVPGRFGRSNLSVMRRGRPPAAFKSHLSDEHFAWCSHADNEILHYIRWRIRTAGVISFVLDTDRRPWQLGNAESVPINRGGLHKITDNERLEEITPVPEVYELQEVLYGRFSAFIAATFHKDILQRYFESVAEYERLLSRLFVRRPTSILNLLLTFQDVPINCDHWNLTELEGTFSYFLVTLRLLSDRYDDLQLQGNYLRGEGLTLGVIDCDMRASPDIIDDLIKKPSRIADLDILFLQRVSKLILWDGAPTKMSVLKGRISINGTGEAEEVGSVSRAPSPQVVDVGSLVTALDGRCRQIADVRRVLNELL